MNGDVVSMYVWHTVNGTAHAFNRWHNTADTVWWKSLCQERVLAPQARMQPTAHYPDRSVPAARCFACVQLVDAGSI